MNASDTLESLGRLRARMLEEARARGRGAELELALPALDRATRELARLAPMVDAGDELAARDFRDLVLILREETQALDDSYRTDDERPALPAAAELVAHLLTETNTWPRNRLLRRAARELLRRLPPSRTDSRRTTG